MSFRRLGDFLRRAHGAVACARARGAGAWRHAVACLRWGTPVTTFRAGRDWRGADDQLRAQRQDGVGECPLHHVRPRRRLARSRHARFGAQAMVVLLSGCAFVAGCSLRRLLQTARGESGGSGSSLLALTPRLRTYRLSSPWIVRGLLGHPARRRTLAGTVPLRRRRHSALAARGLRVQQPDAHALLRPCTWWCCRRCPLTLLVGHVALFRSIGADGACGAGPAARGDVLSQAARQGCRGVLRRASES